MLRSGSPDLAMWARSRGPGGSCQLQLSWPNLLAGSYVEGIVSLHYKTDEAVKEDLELQTWCREITEIGLLGAQDQGELSPCPETSSVRFLLGTSPESSLLL